MLLTIEKVIILKSVSIFSQIPEEALVEVASILEEVRVEAGKEIIVKGDVSNVMYIIIEGRVRVHDGANVLTVMGEREVFGELAALDPVPRSASVTSTEDSYLFRMDRAALFELMSQHVGVAQGIIRVLCQRIRACAEQLRTAQQKAQDKVPARSSQAAPVPGK